ncbi:MAG: acetylxylan esterase [Planctomycetaceae bacterium]|nr:acetylxylan esterase [Planctomycetaceae bacterium]
MPKYALRVVTDRDDALYEVGETATFLVTLSRDGQPVVDGEVKYVVGDFLKLGKDSGFPEGTVPLAEQPARVEVTLDQPGFLRCEVSYETAEGQTLKNYAGAGFSPLQLEPSLPVPDDFDEYWSEQKQLLAEVEMVPVLTPVEQDEAAVVCFDVQVPCLGGAPVSGYLARPAQATPETLPAILWVHGAGVRSSSLANAIQGARAGMLSMDINAHGIPNGRPDKFYSDLANGELKDYRTAGRESRDTVYFRGMFLRLARAIEFLTAQPEWDGQILAVIGHSQGGGQALVAGGLDERVTFIATGVPAICDHSGLAAGRINGWPKLVPEGEDGLPDSQILEAARYVDAVNFASRCKADAIMSVGFIDTVCPPSSCYAAFNVLEGEKEMINEPLMGHAAPEHIKDAFFQRILEHVKARRSREQATESKPE